MKAPEITYRFQYRRDTAGPTFEIVHRTFTLSDTDATMQSRLSIIPLDKVLVLSNIAVQANPGATQAVDDIRVSGFTPAGLEFNISRFVAPGTADANVSFNWQGEVYIHGREPKAFNVQVFVTFDAGANANVVDTTISGIVIPRGNAALF